MNVSGVEAILRREPSLGIGYRIHTAYPCHPHDQVGSVKAVGGRLPAPGLDPRLPNCLGCSARLSPRGAAWLGGEARRQALHLLASVDSEEDLRRVLLDDLRGNYWPPADNFTFRTWLERVAEELTGPAS
jgi:hypothetical protein